MEGSPPSAPLIYQAIACLVLILDSQLWLHIWMISRRMLRTYWRSDHLTATVHLVHEYMQSRTATFDSGNVAAVYSYSLKKTTCRWALFLSSAQRQLWTWSTQLRRPKLLKLIHSISTITSNTSCISDAEVVGEHTIHITFCVPVNSSGCARDHSPVRMVRWAGLYVHTEVCEREDMSYCFKPKLNIREVFETQVGTSLGKKKRFHIAQNRQ